MQASPSFAQVLDDTLAAPRRTMGSPPCLDVRPDPGLRFAMAVGAGHADILSGSWARVRLAAAGPTDWRAGGRHDHAATALGPCPVISGPRRQPPRPAESAARRPVALLPAERDALQVLRRSGAGELRDDFTTAELKQAYRRLAQHYHPDRHHLASPQQRARLADAFRRVHAAYHLLRRIHSRPA